MFGGLCFMVNGNMCFGVVGSELMVRVGPDAYQAPVTLPHAREMDFTGRSMRGMVYVPRPASAKMKTCRRGWTEGSGSPRLCRRSSA